MMKIKKYDQFYEEISIKKAIGAGLIGAATLGNPNTAYAGTPPVKTETDTITTDKQNSIEKIVDTIQDQRPELFKGDSEPNEDAIQLTEDAMPNFEKLSYLENIIQENEQKSNISLNDINLLSKPGIPIRINYFYVRGLDSYGTSQQGPFLIPILNIDYSGVKMAGHDVMFNFTRINDVNTFGTRINF